MPIFLLISRHSPENCPMFNEKARKVNIEYMSKVDGLAKKHGLKNLGGWTVPNEHMSVGVIEAPSLEAFQKASMEPEVMALGAYETWEVKAAMSTEEAMKLLLRTK